MIARASHKGKLYVQTSLVRRYLPFVIVVAVALLTVGSGTLLYRAKRSAAAITPKNQGASAEDRGNSAHSLGPADAPVTLEEFGDFQCPPCGKLAEPISRIQKEYNLRVIFREFPLAMHQHAREAALAAEAAGLQGRFWEMHDLLYREQEVWSKSTDAPALFKAYAGILGLDITRFKKDSDSDKVKEQVALDERRGAVIGVRTTPTIFLNNRAIPSNALNPIDLRTEVARAVKNARPSS